jgi:hypothetical protein
MKSRFHESGISYFSVPRRDRTFDLRIKSPMLYQLSYRDL